ncbi:MAG: hypothetical protein ACREC4_11315, partial [Methylocella sp.]
MPLRVTGASRNAGLPRRVRDYVESEGGDIELEFLPSYAPELNPPLATPLSLAQRSLWLAPPVEYLWG